MTSIRLIGCPPWLKRLKDPIDRFTGLCQREKYHSLTTGMFAHTNARTVHMISRMLDETRLLNLLQKL
jgi:hypothetical protein